MAKKKRRKPHGSPRPSGQTTQQPSPPPGPAISPAAAARRDRKEEARRQREAVMRGMRRREILRRVVIFGAAAAVVAGIAIFFVGRAQETSRLQETAEQAARAAGCSEVRVMPDQGAGHLQVGQTFDYPDDPPTSGVHNPGALRAGVYTEPVDVTQAVHSLEHGYVVMWYRAEGEGALPQAVVDRLAGVQEGETILAPYPELPEGTALAITAWNRLQECPAGITADQAATLAQAFFRQFKNSTAPENAAG